MPIRPEYPPRGLFITGTNTEVGKTFLTALLARFYTHNGLTVGLYKPAASGCHLLPDGSLLSDDAQTLWNAIGQREPINRVCPQTFQAPLAPHLAAKAEGKTLSWTTIQSGLTYWKDRCDLILVEGAGGYFSPMGEDRLNADLAHEFGYPVAVVAPNELGVIHQTLQTLFAVEHYRGGLETGAVFLNDLSPSKNDLSQSGNLLELCRLRSDLPIVPVNHAQTTLDDKRLLEII
ncbi:MAG: dethiobiotin synthase [Pirellulaceae bacterium]|nr:dethiobiotin synthase [Pirellulaceae bacterium]